MIEFKSIEGASFIVRLSSIDFLNVSNDSYSVVINNFWIKVTEVDYVRIMNDFLNN